MGTFFVYLRVETIFSSIILAFNNRSPRNRSQRNQGEIFDSTAKTGRVQNKAGTSFSRKQENALRMMVTN